MTSLSFTPGGTRPQKRTFLDNRIKFILPVTRPSCCQTGVRAVNNSCGKENNQLNISKPTTKQQPGITCVCILLPECHQWKPAVHTAAVMLRTPPRRRPITGKLATSTSHIRRTILRTPPVTRQSAASSARRPHAAGHSHYVVISRAMDASL